MLNDLRTARTEISMESVAGGNPDKVAEQLPTFLDKAAQYLSKTSVLQTLGDFFAIKNLGWLALNIGRRPYSELRGIQVITPAGFKGSLAEYGATLVKAAEAVGDLEADVLAPYGKWVSERIADPASLRSLTNTLKIPGLHPAKTDALQKSLDSYFPDKHDGQAPIYGDVFKRQADWTDLNNQVKKLNTLYSTGKFEAVQKKVAELSQLLDVLAKRIGEESKDFTLSSVTTEQLSKVTLQVAEDIEFYGVLRHRVEEFLQVVGQNVEVVKTQV